MNRKKAEEEFVKKKKSAQAMVKRYAKILKGYEKNYVTKSESNNLYYNPTKGHPVYWKPVMLMDKERRRLEEIELAKMIKRNALGYDPRDSDRGEKEKKIDLDKIFLQKKNWNKEKARDFVTKGPTDNEYKLVFLLIKNTKEHGNIGKSYCSNTKFLQKI